MERATRYEDPLEAALAAAQAGAITGGGTQLTEDGRIAHADVDLDLADLGPALDLVARSLEEAGAPAGSELLSDDGVLRTFGTQECVAIFLDGISLPDAVYAELDFEDVVRQLTERAGADSYRGFWQGPEETGLFFYGAPAEDVWKRLEPQLRQLPIGQNARVVIGYSKQEAPQRTVRLPRH